MRRWNLLVLVLVLAAGGSALAQAPGRVVGTVTAEGGRALPNAIVTVIGTGRGVLADRDGKYTITDVPAGTHQVQARLVGYTPGERQITLGAGGTVTADFELKFQAVQLEGIVVTGYSRQERRDLTGSVASVRATEIQELPTSNVMKALQGRIAGVDIVNTNYRPGAALNVRIRGIRSMVATNEPLFVVDGVPIAGGIEDFAPDNIESVEVLKDASATAQYGSRGSNGVILITTRGGNVQGGTRITYEANYGAQRPINLADMMNAEEFATYKREAWRAAGRDTTDDVVFTPIELYSLRNGLGTDWQRVILRTGKQQEHQFAINTASAATRLAFSGNYIDQQGLTLGQAYTRYNGTLSMEHTTGRLRIGLTASGSRSVADIGQGDGLWGEALANNPIGVPFDSLGILNWKPTPDPLRVNPLFHVDNWSREQTRNRLFGSIFSDLRLTDNLNWRVNFGPDLSDRLDGEFRGQFTTDRNGALPRAFRTEEETFSYTLDNLLLFNKTFRNVHRLDFTGLYSIQKEQFEQIQASAENLPFDSQWYNLGTGEVRANLQSAFSQWALESYMGRINYALRDKYLLTLTGRYDGSSRLAEGNKWAFFPSVGLGWQLGDEPFVQSMGLFSSLKLRGSWGRTGNTGINPYQTFGSLDQTRYNYGAAGANGYRPGQISNPDLKWEKTDQYDIGIDFGVFDNRLSGTIDWYRQETKDLLMARQLPASSGFTQTLQNIGQTRNTGWEFAISTLNMDSRAGFRWTTDINFTHNKNEIVSLFGLTQDDPGNFWFIGQPINVGGANNTDGLRRVFFDFEKIGIWQTADSALAASFGQRPGEIRVKDQNGDGVINADDRVILGNTYPKWTGSVYNRVSYKGFDFSALATARLGLKIFDTFGTATSALDGRYGNLDVDYWTPTNPTNAHPRPSANREAPLYNTTRGYVNGSNVRVRNIQVGYNLPPSLLSQFRMSGLRVYGTVQEPFVFTSYEGYDPEAGTFGTPPSYRTFLLGTNITF